MSKKTQQKSRTPKKPKNGLRIKPWMAVLLVLLVVVVGIVVVRLSRAGGTTGVMYAGMPSTQVCTNNFGQVKSLYVCGGSLVDTADGQAWRTSVNEIGPVQWFGPYEKLTVWPTNDSKKISMCVTFRDNLPFGIKAEFTMDITSDNGVNVIASKNFVGQNGSFKTSPNSLTITCLPEVTLQNAQSYPRVLNNVEYRIRVTKGSMDIYQVARTLNGTVSSDTILPASRPDNTSMIWPVNTAIAKMRGPGSPGGSGCYGATRNSGNPHKGVDLIGTGNLRVVNGNLYNDIIDVYAARSGKVISVANDPSGFGPYLIIEHEPNLFTLYGHLSSIVVSQGQQVSRGQVIGRTGEGGNAGPILPGYVHTGNQVHFQVQKSPGAGQPFGNTINPLDIVKQPIDKGGC